MRNRLWIALIVISLHAFWTGTACPAGRLRMPDNHPWSGSMVLNAWCRDRQITVAVCNLASKDRTVRIALGTNGKTQTLFASTTRVIPGSTIQSMSSPVVRRQTLPGDLKAADTVFVFAAQGTVRGLIAKQPIQYVQVGQRFAALTHFIVAQGGRNVYRYAADVPGATTIALIPKSIDGDRYTVAVRPLASCPPAHLDEDDLQKMGFSSVYRQELMTRMSDNFLFRLSGDGCESAGVVLHAAEIDACARVAVPTTTYVLNADGSLTAGGGQGLGMMIYDPLAIAIQPVTPFVEERGEGQQKKADQP